jgi:CBS domain-containing protein
MRVEDVMSTNVVTVSPQTPLKRVAELLVWHQVSGLPVIDAQGRLLGVVSKSDILHKEREGTVGSLLGRLLGRHKHEEAKQQARTAGDAMTAPAITAHSTMPVSDAAARMLEHGVDRLVVVPGRSFDGNAEDTTVVGIVSRGDCVRAFARPDEEISAELRRIANQYGLLLPERGIAVNRGEVALEGTVELRTDAEDLAAAAARVPGVVSVDNRLSWRLDQTRHANDDAHLLHH